LNLNIDSHAVSIPCPHCSKKFDEKIGRLKRDPKLTCPACRETFTVNAEKLRAGIKSVQKTLDDFTRKLSKLGK